MHTRLWIFDKIPTLLVYLALLVSLAPENSDIIERYVMYIEGDDTIFKSMFLHVITLFFTWHM